MGDVRRATGQGIYLKRREAGKRALKQVEMSGNKAWGLKHVKI
ncbi:hypothetical protein Pvag_pPag30391 (plasmid) [Pantoea vagans C9-1]|nr:hypothetical protein Pvag_pPag30391 [Pantoea vagans C9-1]